MEQKFRHAEKLRDELGVRRPILVDSLDGVCQKAAGTIELDESTEKSAGG